MLAWNTSYQMRHGPFRPAPTNTFEEAMQEAQRAITWAKRRTARLKIDRFIIEQRQALNTITIRSQALQVATLAMGKAFANFERQLEHAGVSEEWFDDSGPRNKWSASGTDLKQIMASSRDDGLGLSPVKDIETGKETMKCVANLCALKVTEKIGESIEKLGGDNAGRQHR